MAKEKRPAAIAALVAGILTALAVLVVILGGLYELALVWIKSGAAVQGLNRPIVKVATSAAIFLGAIGLYLLKTSRFQAVYGLLEMAVGLVTNWKALDSITNSSQANTLFARLAVLGGGVYLIGRGMNNLFDGVKKAIPLKWEHIVQAYKEGYARDTGVAIPQSLIDRQAKIDASAQAESPNIESSQ